jgi:Ca-activated chloride channel family protein
VRDLQDSYASAPAWGGGTSARELEERIVNVSLRFGVLCRFTAYIAVDPRIVSEGGGLHRVIQPVEAPAGWDMLAAGPPTGAISAMQYASAPMSAGYGAVPQCFAAPSPMGALIPKVPPTPPGHSELTAAREQAQVEARRLRQAGRLADYERRDLLADLASRLAALVRHLTAAGAPSSEFSSLTELIAAVEAGDAIETVWERAVQALDAFAAGKSKPKRRAFWKRG